VVAQLAQASAALLQLPSPFPATAQITSMPRLLGCIPMSWAR
jgi:hypothetical protein